MATCIAFGVMGAPADHVAGAGHDAGSNTLGDPRIHPNEIVGFQRKMAAHVGALTHFDSLHPHAVHAEGDVVLILAGGAARMTADALRLVDDPVIIHGRGSAAYLEGLSRNVWRQGRKESYVCLPFPLPSLASSAFIT